MSTSTPAGAFAPGTLISERYRIVGMLGRGGMGDVYRADDLTLGQSVALKFLSGSLAQDPDRRTRFLNEVRTAREVAHPNVCRVYDFGEIDGHAFLSMEFVDGEDLSSLLRRIGRLPQEKAIEIARQLCAGLGALHDRGVLHRDLKPANVMVDGRGRVRITDFGLADAGGGAITGAEARAGTPAYMAPEQLDGERADERSDIWALGLVLYEVFTGKRAFEADTVADLQRKQRETTPTSVTTLLPDLDPAIERVIARCLDQDPERRPASAFAVAAALPGGDPLAAALAAGEIPSVEMVAAAGEAGGVRPWVATVAALAVLVGILLVASVNQRGRITHWDPLEKPPAVLADRARSILAAEGYGEVPVARKWGFSRQGDALGWIVKHDSTAERWDSLREARPAGIAFWYREAPEHMVPRAAQGGVTWDDPSATEPGMVRLALDTKGRLLYLAAVPPDRDPALPDSGDVSFVPEPPPEPDWSRLLTAAGVDPDRFAEAEPEWLPLHYADTRRAWVGEWAEWPGHEIRIEAASLRGQAVIFRVLGPWKEPRGVTSDNSDFVAEALIILVIFSVLVAALFLAFRNLRLGRGDRAGATRLAVFVFGAALFIWVLTYDHVPEPDAELQKLLDFAAHVALVSGLFWAFYLALEPYVRKTMPKRIVSWSRLLTGRWKDPLIGRDILVGGVFFLFLTLADSARTMIPDLLGNPLPRPGNVALDTASSTRCSSSCACCSRASSSATAGLRRWSTCSRSWGSSGSPRQTARR